MVVKKQQSFKDNIVDITPSPVETTFNRYNSPLKEEENGNKILNFTGEGPSLISNKLVQLQNDDMEGDF